MGTGLTVSLSVGDAQRWLLVLDSDGEQFLPGRPRRLYDLPGQRQITEFAQALGANFHCHRTARQLTHSQMFDWPARYLPGGSRP